jgi:hypothetical protein
VRAREVFDQSRELIILGIEVVHRKLQNLRRPLQGLQIRLPTYPSSVHGLVMQMTSWGSELRVAR